MGESGSLILFLGFCFGLLGIVIARSSSSFGKHAIAASSVSEERVQSSASSRSFKISSTRQALRAKEWALLRRDPWLVSQTLMQILYLLPPALLMWMNFGENSSALVIVIPVLVMSAGQLAGGLAWLAISGEDAPDLIATAPISSRAILTAKIEAILSVIGMIMLPLVVAIAFVSPYFALVTIIGVALSAGSATAIQLWFRVQAKRTMFRRRQVSSRTATLSEAFSSIMWAGTAALVAAEQWLFVAPALSAIMVMAIARAMRPKED